MRPITMISGRNTRVWRFVALFVCWSLCDVSHAFQRQLRRRLLRRRPEAKIDRLPQALQLNSTLVGVPTVPSVQQQRIYMDHTSSSHVWVGPTTGFVDKMIQSSTTIINVPQRVQTRIADRISAMTLVPSRTTLTVAGSMLAMNSGFLNGVALSGLLFAAGAPTQAVSACTGAYTNLAVAAATASSPYALLGSHSFWFPLGATVSYCFGSFLNGILCPHGVKWTSRVPAKSLIVSAALVATSFCLQPIVQSPRLIWYLLTIACGLQTSFTSMLVTGNLLRSAHFSGITSDFGTVLGQILRGNAENAWKIPVWISLMTSFTVGGILSVRMLTTSSVVLGHPRASLLLPMAMYLLVAASASIRQRLVTNDN